MENQELEYEQNLPEAEATAQEVKKSKKKTKARWLSLFMVAVFIMGGIVGSVATVLGMRFIDGTVLVKKDFLDHTTYMAEKYNKLEYLYRVIESNYYGDYTDEQLMTGTYEGLFSALDKWSEYLTAEEMQQLMNYTNSSFQGIGVVMQATKDNRIKIMAVYNDAPAEKAGLKPGDYIVAVDGKTYDGAHLEDCSNALRNEIGTKVKVTYERGGAEKTVTITCNTVDTGTIYSGTVKDSKRNIGYIMIGTFGEKTAEEFDRALRNFEVEGCEAVIIDLRGNGGGVVDSATAIADRLLPEGNIIVTKSKVEGEVFTNSDASCTKLPFVLLVDENTASSAEILTAAVKGNQAAPVVGTKTYGKGVLQKVANITKDGKDAFRITYAEYFGPGDLKINGVGIEPDYVVEQDEDSAKDMQLEKAISLLEQKLSK